MSNDVRCGHIRHVVKFLVLLAVGCSPLTAVRHVWYDRFDKDEDEYAKLVFMGTWQPRPQISISASGTVDPAPIATSQGDSTSDGDDFTCTNALPVTVGEQIALADLPCTNVQPHDATLINPSPRFFLCT
jgi:hypothetical protein